MGIVLNLTNEYFGELQRDEDKFVTNIDEMKEIDLGKNFMLTFADRDLIINGQDKFNWFYVESVLDKIKKTGWDLLPYKGFNSMFQKGIKSEWIPYKCGIIWTTESDEELIFRAKNEHNSDTYWCGADKDLSNSKTARCFYAGADILGEVVFLTNNKNKNEMCKIRLVKYKFPDEDFFK
jgi:hypothetical protein